MRKDEILFPKIKKISFLGNRDYDILLYIGVCKWAIICIKMDNYLNFCFLIHLRVVYNCLEIT